MYDNILVPVSFEADRNAREAMDIAQAIRAEGGKITLLHVMEQVPTYAISYTPQEYLVESRKAIDAELAEMASRIPGAQGIVVDGHAGRTITDWAEENAVDCIVIASRRPGMADLLLGSTAHQVVRHATCAVHVVR